MSSYKIILSDNAYKDIRNISKYISTELHDKDAAKRLLSIFYQTIESLSELPERQNVIEKEVGIIPVGIRRVNVKNYSIFYTCSGEEMLVRIWRIVYNRREWQNLL